MRRLLGSYLSAYSNLSLEAEDGLQALDQLKANAPVELALVDWDMPRMNGLEFVKAVRAEPAYASTKLLMVTSHNTMEDVGEALAAGADDFLMKPMTEDMVVDKIRMLGLIS
jgi:two-component system chemotaxis response regulator CheY